ncbi:MAG: transporter related [Bacteroidetes bacterium]|nr:transporter related [Bacteroidota bacterium]
MIQVEHLTKCYGKFTAVADVSLAVQQGQVYALLGPNGSGKTTTLKTIVGLTIPSQGKILINGLNTKEHSKVTLQLLSYLPQRVVFPENQTAREILMFYCRIRKLPLERANDALGKARFNGFSDKLVGEFSGGMIQRLGLAVLSLADSPILVLDEPTANLDPQGVKRFREFILGQKEMGKTIIFSTHLLAEAEQLADRVGIFVGGRLVADESVENLQRTRLTTQTIEDLYLHYVGSKENE